MTLLENDWEKDPNATLDWSWDWSDWIDTPGGEVITVSTFSATPGISIGTTSNTATSATAWLSGGTDGRPYTVTNEITTNKGRIDNRSITIRVKNR